MDVIKEEEQDLTWDQEWLQWFEEVLRDAHPSSILGDLTKATAAALAQFDYPTASSLTRTLAADIAQQEWSHNEIFMHVKRVFCDTGNFAGREFSITEFTTALNEIFRDKSKFRFNVTFMLAPVSLTRAVARKFDDGRVRLLLEPPDGNDQVLTGVEIEIDASDVHEAAALAIENARSLLEELRLLFYIRTHLCGSVRVSQAEPLLDVHLSLPQPFWKKAQGRRAVPRVPPDYSELISMLQDEERSQWKAALWHLSHALSDWAEDTHSAASRVWQALEAFSGSSGLHPVLNLIPEYFAYAARDMGAHLATRVSLQAQQIRGLSQRCDWVTWDRTRMSFQEWLERVLSAESFNFYGHWQLPMPPPILFHTNAGLLQIIGRRLRAKSSDTWMEQRTECDLTLLYGLRNKAVHSGRRVLGRRAAMYLGQTGAEVLLGVMATRAQRTRGLMDMVRRASSSAQTT